MYQRTALKRSNKQREKQTIGTFEDKANSKYQIKSGKKNKGKNTFP